MPLKGTETMLPILLIHGYSSEGEDNTVKSIYGSLPKQLGIIFGKKNIKSINLIRWISLNDGISLDDVSYAMDRALKASHPELLTSGFHVVIHSTGAWFSTERERMRMTNPPW